jgi:hypothetical protein
MRASLKIALRLQVLAEEPRDDLLQSSLLISGRPNTISTPITPPIVPPSKNAAIASAGPDDVARITAVALPSRLTDPMISMQPPSQLLIEMAQGFQSGFRAIAPAAA